MEAQNGAFRVALTDCPWFAHQPISIIAIFREDLIFFSMCSYHQPQQIINERPIPSHGSAWTKALTCFGLLLCKVGFDLHTVRTGCLENPNSE